MATLQVRNGSFRVLLCYLGRRHAITLGKVSRREAEAKGEQIDYLLLRIKQKLLSVPPGVSIEDFMLQDGNVKTPAEAARAPRGRRSSCSKRSTPRRTAPAPSKRTPS